MKAVELNIDDIKPYWRNPRDNESAVAIVQRSIENYGYNSPIIVDKNNVIITGHTRHKALRNLGYEKVMCLVSDLPDEKANAYRIIDNKASEYSKWNMDLLMAEINQVADDDFVKDMFKSNIADEIAVERYDVTEKNVSDVSERLEHRFENLVEEANDGLIEVVCPKCGKKFFIRVTDLVEKDG